VAFTATPSMLMALHMLAPAPSIFELWDYSNEKQKLHLHLQTLIGIIITVFSVFINKNETF
jgi:hypothetical protein